MTAAIIAITPNQNMTCCNGIIINCACIREPPNCEISGDTDNYYKHTVEIHLNTRSDITNIHILTLNVQDERGQNKQERVYEWTKQRKANILFLQETHLTADTFQTVDQQFKGTIVHLFGTSTAEV